MFAPDVKILIIINHHIPNNTNSNVEEIFLILLSVAIVVSVCDVN